VNGRRLRRSRDVENTDRNLRPYVQGC
jgi:hypothetical protein